MIFNKLIMIEESTGKVTVLYDGQNFQNFDYLKSLVGKDYIGLNEDLMASLRSGKCEGNNGEVIKSHCIWKSGEIAETLIFNYEK